MKLLALVWLSDLRLRVARLLRRGCLRGLSFQLTKLAPRGTIALRGLSRELGHALFARLRVGIQDTLLLLGRQLRQTVRALSRRHLIRLFDFQRVSLFI